MLNSAWECTALCRGFAEIILNIPFTKMQINVASAPVPPDTLTTLTWWQKSVTHACFLSFYLWKYNCNYTVYTSLYLVLMSSFKGQIWFKLQWCKSKVISLTWLLSHLYPWSWSKSGLSPFFQKVYITGFLQGWGQGFQTLLQIKQNETTYCNLKRHVKLSHWIPFAHFMKI